VPVRARVAFVVALVVTACGASSPSPPLAVQPAPVPVAVASAPSATPAPLPQPPANADDSAVDDAERAYLDLTVSLSPESATGLGIHSRDTELDDYTLAGSEARLKREEAMLASLQARFAPPHVSLPKKVDLELLEHTLEVVIRYDRATKPLVRDPQRYLSVLDTLFAMLARPYAPAEERARAVRERLEKIPAVIAAGEANLDDPPRVWTQVALESARQAPAFLDEVRAFFDASLKDDPPRTARALAGARTAFADYAKFLEHDLLPRSNGDFAAGRPLFDFLLHEGDFLDENADDVLALGRRVFDETEAQMTALAKKIDPKAKGWPEVTKRLKNKHPTAAELLPDYRAQVARARSFLVQKDVVTFPADDDCEILETPPFERATITAAYDVAPAFDPHPKGFFFVTPVDSSLTPKAREELLLENYDASQADTVVHETYPGHHLQESLGRRSSSIIRKMIDTDLFSEGWAFYCEELMSELGYYSDEERLVQLNWTLVRAARVLIDVGLHTQGMTFEQAVAILTEKVHLEREYALNDVRRYASEPTQPLSYLVGREKIFALRRDFERRDPSGYSLKRFHDAVLSHGTIPVTLIAEEILAR
jgi:uncharacterized protein (DUF885 family)